MFLLELDSTGLNKILQDSGVQTTILEIVKKSQPDAITANQFFILSLALALSTYISTVSADIARRLRKDIFTGRTDRIAERKQSLIFLIFGDFLIWLILIPLIKHIHDFLVNNPSFFKEWIAKLIVIATLAMFIAHISQWFKYNNLMHQNVSNTLIIARDFDNYLRAIPNTNLNAQDLALYIALVTTDRNENNFIVIDDTLKASLTQRTGMDRAIVEASLTNLVNANIIQNTGTNYRFQ